MSGEEHHFQSSYAGGNVQDITYPQQAGTIRKYGYTVIKGRLCKVSLLTDNCSTKDDLKLPTDDALLQQIRSGFEEGKDLVVIVMSAKGEEQIHAVKDIGPK
ncbi:hypothetical protein Bca4012_009062 [Brassica carinata]